MRAPTPSVDEASGHRRFDVALRFWPSRDERILVVLRIILILASLAISAATGALGRGVLVYYLPLVVVAVLASLPMSWARSPVASLLEATATVVLATLPEPVANPLLVYWLAPALAAGLRTGYAWSMVVSGVPLVLGLLMVLRVTDTEFSLGTQLTQVLQWSLLSLGLGLMGAWGKSQRTFGADETSRSYARAVRVLTELEEISRELPTGLDVGTLGRQVLDDIMALVPSDRGIVVTRDAAGSFVSVAGTPDASLDWLPDLDVVQSWFRDDRGFDATVISWPEAESAVVQLCVGDRLVGFVVLLRPHRMTGEDRDRVASTADRGALPLEAALLFDAVRDIATNEERRRIAREIHDGIAQDIAFLGYAADEIIELASNDEVQKLAQELRQQISRVVAELRMSVFTLRDSLPSGRTLGSSISDYARRAFQDQDTQIHVVLDESAQRLRPAVEAEVLRIAQEALTNARRHAGARNLWVSCQVDGPHASISIEDDGDGLGQKRPDSYGMEIMSERASRIRADLTVGPGAAGGTVVRLRL